MVKFRPYVILNAAMSVDGKIATRTGKSNLSSKRDLVRLHKLRKSVDAIIVGSKTVRVDNPLLSVRLVKGKNPIRIILDSKGRISSNSRIVKSATKIPTMLIVTENLSEKTEKLAYKGIEIVRCGKHKINLKRLMNILWKKGIRRILVEGGGTTNWYFFKEGLVDEFSITIVPRILGGIKAISFVGGTGFDKTSGMSFKLKKIEKRKNELVLYYIS